MTPNIRRTSYGGKASALIRCRRMLTLGRRRCGRDLLPLVACLLLLGCAGDGGSSRDGQTASADASVASGASAEPSKPGATQPPIAAAPPELAGQWTRSVEGVQVILTLDDGGYRIQRGPAGGSGRISVEGDEIEFSGSNLCDGSGTYTWMLDDGRLRFTEIVADPCDGRTSVLLRGTFGRVDP
jgi:hypothetical protein